MARYDLYRGPDETSYFLDVQADLIGILNTRVIVPLLKPPHAPFPARRLNPIFEIKGQKYVMVTQFISAMAAAELEEPEGNLSEHHDKIVSALDMLFQGF